MNINPIVIFKMAFIIISMFIISSNTLIPNYSQLLQKEKQEKDGRHFISNLSSKPPSGAYFPALHPATTENAPCSLASYINITK